ncbi:Prolyl aminopeptidase [Trichoderma simmonsii]|uniref:Prolyl aminopeptidase n=1 Tax=Trichoderma simmonsii TaxID=1491479 RepID=A0A8G0L0Y3_9HYPO|nr:Prolyl aminopeptidase [Trichoderma simmonsii]
MAVVPSSKPHIFVIPGAYHPGSAFNLFIQSLEAAGFSAETTTNRSAGNAGITVQDDIEHVQSLLIPQIDEGKDIVVVAHSYGGVVGSGVIAGLDKRGREARGLKGGIIGIICIAALMTAPEKSILEMRGGGAWSPWVDTSKLESEGVTYTRNQIETFYHDVSPELAKTMIASLTSQSGLSVQSKPDAIGWLDGVYDGRRAYIRCLQDGALPLAAQDGLLAQSGVEWIIRSLEASHSPYLSMPDELTSVVAEIITEFAKS